jgi:glutathione peroxidase-family protein
MNIYEFKVKDITGNDLSMDTYKGKVLLIVNVASKCGFTPQYAELEELYKKHKEKGFEILGFPCNQFLSQEPKTEEEIMNFCSINYGVTFPMFSKIKVNGPDTEPLYKFLKAQKSGRFGIKRIRWNFTKFLVNKEGEVIMRYLPKTIPYAIETDILSRL